jgi:hypothetical protein
MYHISETGWIVLGVLSVVWAYIGYQLSERCRKATGRTPWGMSSALWAFLWFLSLALGLVLYLIFLATRASSARRAQQMGGFAPTGPASAGFPGRPIASDFPTYPRPAHSSGGVDATPTPTPAPVAPWPSSPPAWQPDPSGRFHYRWWDGHQWTNQVSTDGRQQVDTHPDQRLG